MRAGAGGNIFVDLYLLVILKLFFQVKRTNTNLQKYHHPLLWKLHVYLDITIHTVQITYTN